jgi:hypothetical protein
MDSLVSHQGDCTQHSGFLMETVAMSVFLAVWP